jgi:uncharacterized protein (TIGR03083 family)
MNTRLDDLGTLARHDHREPNHVGYRQVRRNVAELVAQPRAEADPVIPACPGWTLRGLLAHLVGIAATATGRASAPAGDATIPELLAQWELLGAEVDRLLTAAGGNRGNILVMDAFTHELDVRYALGAELPAAHPAFAGAFAVLVSGFSAAVQDNELPAVRLSCGNAQWTAGIGTPAATLTATRYDLYRSLSGRRSACQITDMNWSNGSHRWLPAFTWGPFTPPAAAVEPVGVFRRVQPA